MLDDDKRAIIRILQDHIKPRQTVTRPSILINGDVGIAINVEQRPGDPLPIDQIKALIRAHEGGKG